MEYKSVVAANQITDRTVTGFASIFGNVDDGGDVVMPGAFTKSITERARRIKHLWGHRADEPPTAIIKDIREVGKSDLPPDLVAQWPDASGGLQITREYLDTPRADEILKGIKAGVITEMSFGFEIPKGKSSFKKLDSGENVRLLHEVKLWECSDVQWGMNPATRAAKSVEELADWTAFFLDNVVATGLDLRSLFEAKEGRMISTRNLERLKAAVAALQDVLAAAEPQEPDGDEPKVLALTDTQKSLLLRIELAERELNLWG